MAFLDRKDAGQRLALLLKAYASKKDTLVLGLARGGIVVAYEIAEALHLPLDVICPMKIGSPHNPEYGIGAVTETGCFVMNDEAVKEFGLKHGQVEEMIQFHQNEAKKRSLGYHQEVAKKSLSGKTVIVVDDGMATGYTMQASIKSLREENVQKICIAVPAASEEAAMRMDPLVDESFYIIRTSGFLSVSQFYDVFPQTSHEEVIALLKKASLR